MSYKPFAALALVLFIAPLTAEAVPPSRSAKVTRARATATATSTTAPLLRVFAAVRKITGRYGARQIQIKPAEGQPTRKITARVIRLVDKTEVAKQVGTPTRAAPMKINMPANSDPGTTDVQSGYHQYIISVTAEGETSAPLGNVDKLGAGMEICRVGSIKWFDGTTMADSMGNWLAKRPETDPWPNPDPESSCRF